MIKAIAALLTLCAAGICGAQASSMASHGTSAKHFRLTFVLTYPKNEQPSQTFTLDVPVKTDRTGAAEMSMTAGPSGEPESSIEEVIRCTEVHESSTGLAARVSFTMGSVDSDPLPGSSEHLHHQINFERQVEVPIAKPTRITEQMRAMPLRKGDPLPSPLPPAPQITLTVIEI